jgi:hypothetical protein
MIPVLFPMIPIWVQMKRLFFRVSRILIPNDAPIILEKPENRDFSKPTPKKFTMFTMAINVLVFNHFTL